MAIYSEFSHYKWWFSIVKLVYRRDGDFRESCMIMPYFAKQREEVSRIFNRWSQEAEMDSFFDSNPGFKSRVPFTFRFEAGHFSLVPNYTKSQLIKVFSLKYGNFIGFTSCLQSDDKYIYTYVYTYV